MALSSCPRFVRGVSRDVTAATVDGNDIAEVLMVTQGTVACDGL